MMDNTAKVSGRPVGSVVVVEEECPDCGGEDIGCPFGDWSWGDGDVAGDHG
jgi:hypothetical protein